MFYKFIYSNKKTGRTVYSQKELTDENLVLVRGYKNTSMKTTEVKEKDLEEDKELKNKKNKK